MISRLSSSSTTALLYSIALVLVVSCPSTARAQETEAKSPKEALTADACSYYFDVRTQEMVLVNNSSIGLEIWFAQGKDEVGAPNDDFVEDTGVFVAARNEGGNSRYQADPCYAGGHRRPVQATRCLGSAKFRNGQTLHFTDAVADPGTFFGRCGWQVGARANKLFAEPVHILVDKPQKGTLKKP